MPGGGQHYKFVVCGPDGTEYGEAEQAKQRKLTMLLDGVHSAALTLTLFDSLALRMQPGIGRAKVYRAPSTKQLEANPATQPSFLFYGQLPAHNFELDTAADTDGQAKGVYQDPRWRLAEISTLGTETFTAVDQGDILWQLILAQNGRLAGAGDTYIRQGGTTTGTLRTRDYTTATGSGQAAVQQLFDEMVALDGGCDYDITPFDGWKQSPQSLVMGTLNCYAKQGSDRPNAQFVYGTELLSNCTGMQLSFQKITTLSTRTGSDATGLPLSATAGTPSSIAGQYGLLELIQSEPNAIDAATLTKKVIGDIAALSGLQPILTIQQPLIDAPSAFEDYFLGDTIYATCHKGAFVLNRQALRVHGIDLDIDENGIENVTLTTALL